MSHAHRLLIKWARLVHVYLTLFGLLLVLFFAVTGFILNHADWFDYEQGHETVVTGPFPTNLVAEPEKHSLAIVELLRKDFGATGTMDSFDSKDADEPIDVRFKSAGHDTAVKISRQDGQATVVHTSRGILGLITDLHRGEASHQHTGPAWSLVIDSVAVLLLIVSITGLILWTSLRSRGHHGLAVMGLGLAICAGVYFLAVP
jgi:uncharacterized protein